MNCFGGCFLLLLLHLMPCSPSYTGSFINDTEMLLNLHGGIRADIMFLSTSFDIPICHGDKKPIYLIWKIYALWIKTTNFIRCSKSRSLNKFSFFLWIELWKFLLQMKLKGVSPVDYKPSMDYWLAPPLCPPTPPKKKLHLTPDTWHLTRNTWHMTYDT